MCYVNVLCKYTIVNNIYYCILLLYFVKSHNPHTSHFSHTTATLSNTLVSPKYPNPKRALTNTSPLIL